MLLQHGDMGLSTCIIRMTLIELLTAEPHQPEYNGDGSKPLDDAKLLPRHSRPNLHHQTTDAKREYPYTSKMQESLLLWTFSHRP
jgi:hypothetical protein